MRGKVKLERAEEETVGTLTEEDIEQYENLINGWLIGTIVAGILAILFMVALCCLWDDLKRAINVIDASADFLADTFRIIATPFTHMIF